MSGAAADGFEDRDVPKQDFLLAAFNGDIETIDVMVREEKVSIDSVDDDDVTALHIAAAMGNNNLVLRLLDLGANIEACNQLGMTAYHYAAREGKLAVIDTLLQRGAKYHKKTSLGVSALTLACAGGHTDVVRRLLTFNNEKQTSESPKRTLAPTPLIVATCSKSPQICSYLVRARLQVDETVDLLMGLSALSVAIMCTPGAYMVRTLVDLGANTSKKTCLRMTPEELAKAVNRKDLENYFSDKRTYRNRLETYSDVRRDIKADRVIERELGPPPQNGCTFLMYAIIVRSTNCAHHLINTSDIHMRDNMHITALQIASLLRVDEVIPPLISDRSHVAEINKFGTTAYDLFLMSCDVLEPGQLRGHLHPHRPVKMKVNLGSSSSNVSIYKVLQTTNLFTKVSSQMLLNSVKAEAFEPKQWLEAKIKYQPARNRNTYKFASVDDILRSVKIAKPPETNEYDMETEALREYMEECQSFAISCFTDIYGERDKAPTAEYYDIAQFNAKRSGYHKEEVRRLPTVRPRKDSIEREYRKPRTLSMMDVPSQNQMRTTPRMLKKSRDPTMEYYSAQAGRARAPSNGMQVPTVVVRPRLVTPSVTIESIWSHFIRRQKHQLMEELKRNEIDIYSFFMLRDFHLKEMGIYSPENQKVIEEIQQALSGTL